MLLVKQNFFLIAAIDHEGDVYITAPKFMKDWMIEQWPDAAIYRSDVLNGWLETIVTPAEWKIAVEQINKPDDIRTQEAPFIYPAPAILTEMAVWSGLVPNITPLVVKGSK